MVLALDVRCDESGTMDVTSDQLIVIQPEGNYHFASGPAYGEPSSDIGDELSKRGDKFGFPVGQGTRGELPERS